MFFCELAYEPKYEPHEHIYIFNFSNCLFSGSLNFCVLDILKILYLTINYIFLFFREMIKIYNNFKQTYSCEQL
jgi:hypothetical protein